MRYPIYECTLPFHDYENLVKLIRHRQSIPLLHSTDRSEQLIPILMELHVQYQLAIGVCCQLVPQFIEDVCRGDCNFNSEGFVELELITNDDREELKALVHITSAPAE